MVEESAAAKSVANYKGTTIFNRFNKLSSIFLLTATNIINFILLDSLGLKKDVLPSIDCLELNSLRDKLSNWFFTAISVFLNEVLSPPVLFGLLG